MSLLGILTTKAKNALKRSFFKRGNLYRTSRRDIVVYPIQENAHMEVSWKVEEGGRGASASLFVFNEEILRFDCFCKGPGHYHSNLRQDIKTQNRRHNRLYFVEKSPEEQIERSLFELRRNLLFYLQRNRRSKIRHFEFDPKNIADVSQKMKAKMLEYLRTVPALQFPYKEGGGVHYV